MLDTKPCTHCGQWEGWHCSQIRSFIAHYKYEASSRWTFSSGPSCVLKNGRRYGTVVRVINFIVFTPQLALWRIARICRATILYLSTDSALVILDNSLTHFVWWWSTYLSIVLTSCFSETHLGRMCRFVGHSYKIFYSLFCCRAVSKSAMGQPTRPTQPFIPS